MFGQGSKQKSRSRREQTSRTPQQGPDNPGVNTIDEHTTITGDLEAGGDIRIDGKLIGDLQCRGRLIIGGTGSINGNVTCAEAVIEGHYTGKLVVSDLLTLRETANVTGHLRAAKLAVGPKASTTKALPPVVNA